MIIKNPIKNFNFENKNYLNQKSHNSKPWYFFLSDFEI